MISDPEPCRGVARRQPGHARQPRCGHLRRVHPPRARGEDQALRRGSSTWRRRSSRPNPRGSSSSTCTGCRSGRTRRSSTPGAWTHYSLGDPRRARPHRHPHRRGPPLRHLQARGVEATLGLRGPRLLIAQVYGKGPDGYREALELIANRLREYDAGRAPGRAGRREGTRSALRLGPGQRPLPDRIHRHERRLPRGRRRARSSSPTSATPSGPRTRSRPSGTARRRSGNWCPQIAARMSGRVGFEDAKLSVRQLARLEAATR